MFEHLPTDFIKLDLAALDTTALIKAISILNFDNKRVVTFLGHRWSVRIQKDTIDEDLAK